jgi:hypothetical protein
MLLVAHFLIGHRFNGVYSEKRSKKESVAFVILWFIPTKTAVIFLSTTTTSSTTLSQKPNTKFLAFPQLKF